MRRGSSLLFLAPSPTVTKKKNTRKNNVVLYTHTRRDGRQMVCKIRDSRTRHSSTGFGGERYQQTVLPCMTRAAPLV